MEGDVDVAMTAAEMTSPPCGNSTKAVVRRADADPDGVRVMIMSLPRGFEHPGLPQVPTVRRTPSRMLTRGVHGCPSCAIEEDERVGRRPSRRVPAGVRAQRLDVELVADDIERFVDVTYSSVPTL